MDSHEVNNAAMYNTRRRQGSIGGSQVLDSIISASNCEIFHSLLVLDATRSGFIVVVNYTNSLVTK